MAFGGFLRQSTAVDVLIGPFVDSTDGNTAETGLTIEDSDVRLSKNGQNMVDKNDITSCVHDELGYYNCELDATDTNTVGQLVLAVHEAGALAVRHEFQVLEEAVYDQLFAASAPGAATVAALATVDGNVDSILEDTGTTLDTIVDAILADTADMQPKLGTPAGASMSADIAAVKTDTAAILTDTAVIGAAGAGLTAVPWNADWDAQVQSEVQDAIEANHLDHLLAATYDPAAKPGAADALLNELVESDGGVSRFTANALEEAPTGGSAPTAEEIADAVWDEDITEHANADSAGEALQDAGGAGTPPTVEEIRQEIDANSTQLAAIVADTNELQGDWANGGRLDLIIDAILVDTGTTLQGELDGIQADTEDIQTKIGSPAGASVSADIAAIKTETTAILVDTGTTLDGKLNTIDSNVDAILVDTGTTLQAELDGIQADTEDIQSRLPAALSADGHMESDVLAVNGVEASAAKLERSASTIVTGTVDSTGHTPTTTEFEADDITEATADHFIGRTVIFTSGDLAGQATDITDYALVSGRGHFTVTLLTEAPANNVTFVIV